MVVAGKGTGLPTIIVLFNQNSVLGNARQRNVIVEDIRNSSSISRDCLDTES
jgi:hypothetical protein